MQGLLPGNKQDKAPLIGTDRLSNLYKKSTPVGAQPLYNTQEGTLLEFNFIKIFTGLQLLFFVIHAAFSLISLAIYNSSSSDYTFPVTRVDAVGSIVSTIPKNSTISTNSTSSTNSVYTLSVTNGHFSPNLTAILTLIFGFGALLHFIYFVSYFFGWYDLDWKSLKISHGSVLQAANSLYGAGAAVVLVAVSLFAGVRDQYAVMCIFALSAMSYMTISYAPIPEGKSTGADASRKTYVTPEIQRLATRFILFLFPFLFVITVVGNSLHVLDDRKEDNDLGREQWTVDLFVTEVVFAFLLAVFVLIEDFYEGMPYIKSFTEEVEKRFMFTQLMAQLMYAAMCIVLFTFSTIHVYKNDVADVLHTDAEILGLVSPK